jgi:hypothetical protein
MSHPSFLALDRHALAPEPGEVEVHLRDCARCAEHVRAVLAPAVPFELPRPTAVRVRPSRSPRFLWAGGLALAAAAAVLLVAVMVPGLGNQEDGVRVKGGTPGAVLWVRRDGAVRTWQGERLRAGEEIRFEVAPAGFSHLAVVSLAGAPRILYEVGLSGRASTLSPAWRLDGTTPRDDLAVVLARAPPDEAALSSLLCRQTADSWCTRFTLELEP